VCLTLTELRLGLGGECAAGARALVQAALALVQAALAHPAAPARHGSIPSIIWPSCKLAWRIYMRRIRIIFLFFVRKKLFFLIASKFLPYLFTSN